MRTQSKDRREASTVAKRLLGWWLPFVWFPILLAASQLHTVFNEWGGVMQLFAGQDVLHGIGYRGWTAHFWPPLYSLLMGIGSLWAPGFLVGKMISVLASVLLLHMAYRFALSHTGRVSIAIWTQIFLMVSPLYFMESITAHNHMLDAFLLLAGLHVFLMALRHPASHRIWIAGLICGLASLTRTTSVILVLLAFFPFFTAVGRPAATRLGTRFLGAYVLVVLPWLVMNAVYQGSPFANWQYLNVGAGVLDPANAGSNIALWRIRAAGDIDSVLDLVLGHPVAYARNVVSNIVVCLEMTLRFQDSLMPFTFAGLLDAVSTAALGGWTVTLGLFGLYVLMVSQSHVANWYLLPWVVPMTVLGVRLLQVYADRAEQMYPLWKRWRLLLCGLLLLALYGARSTLWELRRLARERTSYEPLAEYQEVGAAMRAHDPRIDTKVIMAIDPGRAYCAGGKYLMTPLEYQGAVTGLVAYEGLSEGIREYAPKYPALMRDLHADYLVYTRTTPGVGGLHEPRGFDFLLDPSSERVPQTFLPIYRSKNVVVYEIQRSS